jgi:ABC-type transport system involved in multi-copper enzyme maturation permease subunit
MNLPLAIATVWRLIVDTFRQSLASGIFWLIGAASLLIMVMCLSVHIDAPNTLPTRPGERIEALPPTDPEAQDPQKAAGVDIIRGELSFGFGLFRDKVAYEKDTQVRFLLAVLITVFVDTIGVLLALIWTAGFIPAFLEPSNASVLLAKPIPRWSLLAGKFLGVLAFMSLHAIIFIVGTWMALGIKTGVWPPEYLLGIPLLILHFAVFFSFSTLLAVCFRSTVVCVFGTILIWLICWGMNWGRDMLIHVENGSPAPPGYMSVADKAKSKQPKDQPQDQPKDQPKDQAAAPAPAETTPATPKRTPLLGYLAHHHRDWLLGVAQASRYGANPLRRDGRGPICREAVGVSDRATPGLFLSRVVHRYLDIVYAGGFGTCLLSVCDDGLLTIPARLV